MSADANALARRASVHRTGELHPIILALVDDLIDKATKSLVTEEATVAMHRHQGAVLALNNLRRLLTTEFGPDR